MSEDLYKYCKVNDYTWDNLEKFNVCFNSMEQLNDSFEGVSFHNPKMSREEREFFKEIGMDADMVNDSWNRSVERIASESIFKFSRISCFTTDNENELMWAHYADSHKGICIKYRWEDVEEVCDKLQKISYDDKSPELDADKVDESKMNTIYSKSRAWIYESEVRAFVKATKFEESSFEEVRKNLQGNLSYDDEYFYFQDRKTGEYKKVPKYVFRKCIPRAIYCGVRMPLGDFKKLYEYCKKNEIELYKMEQIKRNHALHSKLIL